MPGDCCWILKGDVLDANYKRNSTTRMFYGYVHWIHYVCTYTSIFASLLCMAHKLDVMETNKFSLLLQRVMFHSDQVHSLVYQTKDCILLFSVISTLGCNKVLHTLKLLDFCETVSSVSSKGIFIHPNDDVSVVPAFDTVAFTHEIIGVT